MLLLEIQFYCVGLFWAATHWAMGIQKLDTERIFVAFIGMGLWLGLLIRLILEQVKAR